MITRRSFLSLLASLPIVGKYTPQPEQFSVAFGWNEPEVLASQSPLVTKDGRLTDEWREWFDQLASKYDRPTRS